MGERFQEPAPHKESPLIDSERLLKRGMEISFMSRLITQAANFVQSHGHAVWIIIARSLHPQNALILL
ncbi:hypothetical protein [Megasphaera sp.]|uniref:hypothetical protein n=1 Tax=Megasphaera sp. TaxID=2023260 RepID=UPI00257DFB39|nr:hypothetical protein [Megasphaera sp.]